MALVFERFYNQLREVENLCLLTYIFAQALIVIEEDVRPGHLRKTRGRAACALGIDKAAIARDIDDRCLAGRVVEPGRAHRAQLA